jgi:hypothetical protein
LRKKRDEKFKTTGLDKKFCYELIFEGKKEEYKGLNGGIVSIFKKDETYGMRFSSVVTKIDPPFEKLIRM